MSINKKEVAIKLQKTVMSQPNLKNRAEIEDMFWLLTDTPDDYDIVKEVTAMIKAERLKKGMTQTKLAERAGMYQGRLSEFSNGVRVPQLDHLQKIAHGLGKRLVISFVDVDKKSTVA